MKMTDVAVREQSSVNPSLGQCLKQAREERELSLEAVAKQLNLRPAVLQQIEQDDFVHKSIPSTFMRGYIRNYAKFLRLPEEIWLPVINALQENTVNDLDKNSRSARGVNQYSHHNRWLWKITIVVLLIALGITALWWWQNYQQSIKERNSLIENYQQEQTQSNPSSSALVATENLSLEQSGNQDNATASNSDQNASISTTEATTETLVTNSLSATSENQASVASSSENLQPTTTNETPTVSTSDSLAEAELVIDVSGNCWISVKNTQGKILAQQEYRAGDVLKFNEKSGYDLVIGAASNAKVTYKGTPYPLKVDGRVVRFKLP